MFRNDTNDNHLCFSNGTFKIGVIRPGLAIMWHGLQVVSVKSPIYRPTWWRSTWTASWRGTRTCWWRCTQTSCRRRTRGTGTSWWWGTGTHWWHSTGTCWWRCTQTSCRRRTRVFCDMCHEWGITYIGTSRGGNVATSSVCQYHMTSSGFL